MHQQPQPQPNVQLSPASVMDANILIEDERHGKENDDPVVNDLSQMSLTSNNRKRKQRQGRIEMCRANGIDPNIIGNSEAMEEWDNYY